MPKPTVNSVVPGTVHKHQKDNAGNVQYSDVQLKTCTNVALGDEVVIIGTKGKRKTIWSGTVTAKNGADYVSDDLEVLREEKDAVVGRPATYGPEALSVTVTNSTDTSTPVQVAVNTVP